VAADHIVGIDLELRLGIELGVRRQHENLRHLLAVGLLRVGSHDHLALEHAARIAVEHALEQLAARAARHRVVDDERRVDVLTAARQKRAGESGLLPGTLNVTPIWLRASPCGREVEAR
jgi:hypothetical protein